MLKTETENKDLLKFNAEGVSPYDMWTDAKKACLKAVDDFVAKHGETLYCGFANIVIRPARGRLVKFLKWILVLMATEAVGEYLIMI